MKILVLSKYSDLSPGMRMRFKDYFPYIQSNGYDVTWKPLLSNDYLERIYNNKKVSKLFLFKSYCKRIYWLLCSNMYDVIWLETELFPSLPAWVERIFKMTKTPIVSDFGDAIFHNYDLSRNPVKKFFLKSKIASVMKYSEIVMVGNDYLRRYAKEHGARKIVYVPTVINTEMYKPEIEINGGQQRCLVRIGWLGTISTSKYLQSILPVLSKLAKVYPIQLAIYGLKDFEQNYENLDLDLVTPWTEEGQVPFIQSIDIGIMPLYDNPWERGKCGLKLIQYMGCGKVIVGSPVGVNDKIIEHNVNGFKATTEQEWYDALLALCKNKRLRDKMGKRGYRKVCTNYSLSSFSPVVLETLESAIV